jgi:stage V sporulation protein SpoVS
LAVGGWALFGEGAAADGGVSAAETIARGLVSPSGKLGQLLPALESEFGAAAPANALDALNVVGQATKSIGLESGYVISSGGDTIVLQNAGGVITTLSSDGSILVQRGSDILLHLIP